MAGHSKWANIKRRKGAVDAARGKVFTRLTREIQVAARRGPDPEANFTLRLAIERARAENMPRDTIERAIKRGSGQDRDAVDFEEILYEGYGPHGVALLIECLSDNRNRTIAEIRRVFNRANCTLAEPNAVAWQFERKGLIVIEVAPTVDAAVLTEEIFLLALEAGADDIQDETDAIEIYTADTDLAQVSRALAAAGVKYASMELIMHPKNLMALDVGESLTVLRLMETLEALDDVRRVFHNMELRDDVLEAMMA